jgi:hypothetical protein
VFIELFVDMLLVKNIAMLAVENNKNHVMEPFQEKVKSIK